MTLHIDGRHGHRYHVTRAADVVTVVAHDVITPGPFFARHRIAPPGELADMATRVLVTGERIEPIISDYVNDRVRDVWRVL